MKRPPSGCSRSSSCAAPRSGPRRPPRRRPRNTAADADRRADRLRARRWPRPSSPGSLPAGDVRPRDDPAAHRRDRRLRRPLAGHRARRSRPSWSAPQWTAAAQRTKGMEKLRDRHLEALQHAEDAAEERAVDDLVTGRAGRRTDGHRRGGPVDGVTQVQARISEIQSRFLYRTTSTSGRLGERGRGRRAELAPARRRRGARPASPPRRARSSPRRRSTSASPTSGAAPTPPRAWTARASPSSSSATSASTCPAPPRSRPPPAGAVASAGRRPPRRPRLLRPLVVAGRHRPRRHLHRQRQDDRRPAARRGRQGAGRRQPDRHPPGAARAAGGRRRRRGGSALAGVPYADLFTRAASRHGVDASLLAAVASQESSFNASARLAGRRPGPHAVHAGHREGPRRQPARPGRRRSTAPPGTSAA